MKIQKIFVNELSNFLNKEVISDFLVTQKELREGARDQYIRLKLTDNTGSISGNIWNNAKSFSDKFKESDVIRIKGIIISYKAQLQLTINNVRVLQAEEYDMADFVETTSKDVNKLSERIFQLIDSIQDENIKELLLSIFDDKEFYARFAQSPAAKTWHHNYIGGLIEHTVSVANICDFAARMYPVERDILIAGALLHDIGKIEEYESALTIQFSTIGRLIGHLALSDEMVYKKAALLNNFPPKTLMKIRHLILAHHGEYEKASVRLPQTIEAVVLHFADNLDAQTVGVKQMIEAVQNPDQEWSEFDKLNERYYYLL
jgi:3'-5' exoribonuclease